MARNLKLLFSSGIILITGCGLDGPGIESRWGRDFPHLSRPALGPTQPPVQWIPGFFRGKERPGRDADFSTPSSAVVMKGYSYTSTPPVGRTACTEPQCLYKGALYIILIWKGVPCSFSKLCSTICCYFEFRLLRLIKLPVSFEQILLWDGICLSIV